jgi:hypothetical protein
MPIWKLTLTKQMDIFVEAPTRKSAIDAVESDIDYIPDLENEMRWCDLEVSSFTKPFTTGPAGYTVTKEGNLTPCE